MPKKKMKGKPLRINKYILLSLVFVLLDLFSKLPYFNLVLSFWVVILVLWTISFVVFNLEYWTSYIFSLFLLILIFISVLFKREIAAEEAGNVIFYLMLLGFMDGFFSYVKTIKSKRKK